MTKKIWIVNCYTGSPTKCGNPRYWEFAKHFMENGYNVTIFNMTTVEDIDTDTDFVEAYYEGVHFVHVRNPKYVGNGLKRMMSIWAFSWRLYRKCTQFECPDIILHNLHIPFDYPIFWMAKKLKARYIAEAWDMWPEDFVTFGLLSAKNPVMKIAHAMEKHLLEKADEIVYTFEGGLDYLHRKGWTTDENGKIKPEKVHYINNGVQLEEFDKNIKKYPRPDSDIQDDSLYKIIYMGAIRFANNVKQLIDAAAILKENPKYRFFIYGDGSDRDVLQKYCLDNQITNVVFKEKRIPLCEVPWVVSQATVNVMNYQKNFGPHGVSSGKMFQYFAAGKPICCNIPLKYSEISRRNLGIDKDLDTPEKYAEAIRYLAEQNPEEYKAMCARVRKAGEDFDLKKLSAQELEVVIG